MAESTTNTLITSILSHLARYDRDNSSGELVIRVALRAGGIRQVKIERNEAENVCLTEKKT